MFQQYEIPYAYNALEPHIDELTMLTHSTKHHAGYTKNFNDALAKLPQFDGLGAEQILTRLDEISDAALRAAVQNNGGGFYNHNLYFAHLSPNGGGEPSGELAAQIERTFGGIAPLREQLSAAGMGRFGSGWAWLSANAAGELKVSSTPNQDNPIMESKGAWTPILGIDVWEHAYYLKYRNLRGDYLKAFFEVVDWQQVARSYAALKA
ncbi:MAG: superoxide dismutase [Anaerolineae bacterium]|nr:superoxide dismutase [Anaerolineae bacterium]